MLYLLFERVVGIESCVECRLKHCWLDNGDSFESQYLRSRIVGCHPTLPQRDVPLCSPMPICRRNLPQKENSYPSPLRGEGAATRGLPKRLFPFFLWSVAWQPKEGYDGDYSSISCVRELASMPLLRFLFQCSVLWEFQATWTRIRGHLK